MDHFTLLLRTVSEMAVMIAIGVIISRFVSFTQEVKRLMIFLFINVGVPSIVFHGIVQVRIEESMVRQILTMVAITLLLHVLFLLTMRLVYKPFAKWLRFDGEAAVLSTIGNTGTIGLALCATLFGPVGALFAAVYDIGMTFALWVISPMLVGENRRLSLRAFRNLLTMPMIAVVAGIICALSGITVPPFVVSLTARTGDITVPVAMIYMGLLMAANFAQIRATPVKVLVTPAAAKLFLFPLAAILFAFLFRVPPVMAQVLLIMSAVPASSSVAIVFAKFGGDENYAVLTSLFTMILSLMTIPLVAYWGGLWLGS